LSFGGLGFRVRHGQLFPGIHRFVPRCLRPVMDERMRRLWAANEFNGGTFAWFESGAVDDNGAQHNDGLPAGLTFTSTTGSGATYQIQPANGTNVLQLGSGNTGTLILPTPAVYSTLYILASSGDGTLSSLGSGTIHFADGSTQDFSYKTFDWCNGQGGLHAEAVLSGPNCPRRRRSQRDGLRL
jgi:hypothetical protein